METISMRHETDNTSGSDHKVAGSWTPCGSVKLDAIAKAGRATTSAGIGSDDDQSNDKTGAVSDKASEQKEAAAIEESWSRIKSTLQAQLGIDIFNSWFGRLKFCNMEGGVVLLSVPTTFLKSWLLSHYREKLLELWQEEYKNTMRVDIVVRKPVASASLSREKAAADAAASNGNSSQAGRNVTQTGMQESIAGNRRIESATGFAGSPLDPRHTFENFEEGASNRMVHAAALTIADEVAASHFNPLFIHADVGQGKTHLLQAIAWRTRRQNSKVRVLYLTAEYFMWRFATAIRDKTALTLKESLRDIDILLIDDMQFLQGQAIQAEFCHLLNELIDSARQVVVAADRPPAELESLDERVRSRLKGGVTLEIKAPDYELRKKILHSRYLEAKAEQPSLDIPEDILHYVARQVSSSGRDIEGAFNQLLVHHQFSEGGISLEDLDRILDHLTKTTEAKRIKIEDIQRVVARQFNVSRNDLLSNRRTRNIVRPRQIAMYLAKVMTPRSLPEIGRRFGGRDHTTVLHAVRKIESLAGEDQKLGHEIELLKRLILE